MDISIPDTPTHRVRFDELALERQEEFLDGIRERRLRALQVYQELQAKKQAIRDEKLAVKASKLAGRIDKKLVLVEKSIVDLEKMIKDAKIIITLTETAA